MKENIRHIIRGVLVKLGLPEADFAVEQTTDLSLGDYAVNVAMVLNRVVGKSPKEIAENIVSEIKNELPDSIKDVSVAGPGFINFYLSDDFLRDNVEQSLTDGQNWGKSDMYSGQKVVVEYTDPNPFKVFHIGHLMSNAVGESISRLFEFSGADTKRVCYQGDVGLHVAKTIWSLIKNGLPEVESAIERVRVLGQAYADGSKSYEESEEIKKEIIDINKKVYDRSDEEINKIYDLGKAWSLEYFETIYKKLGTNFDFNIFESETGGFGREVVLSHPEIFIGGENGAKIYEGEQDGLHTRVFVNAEGLPTYESKELGLAKIKHDKFPYDISVVITGNEVNDYFKVVLSAMKKVFSDLAEKTRHISHGMLRLPSGKMSSRTGDVISAESLIDEVKEKVNEKVKDREEVSDGVVEQIAIGAIKYSILKQDPSKDIIFDFDKSLSFEGNSGPYLQYTFARASSVIRKGEETGVFPDLKVRENPGALERLIVRFPEISRRATENMSPQTIATYAIELASTFNAYYANNQILGMPESPYRLALSASVAQTLANCLWLLGISAPEKM